MSDLTFRDKSLIADVLEFDGGYVFTMLKNYESINKTTIRNIIYGASGIDIYVDPRYKDLGQQKCLEKIWESGLGTVGANPEVTLSQAVEAKTQWRGPALQNQSSGPASEAGR